MPSLPIGWAWRRAERSLLLQTLSAVYRAVCTGEKKTIIASKRCVWVLSSFNGPDEVHGNVGRRGFNSTVPEHQRVRVSPCLARPS